MIKHYTLLTLQTAINKTLALDENIEIKLRPLCDKYLKIIILPLNIHFYIYFQATTVTLLPETIVEPDTTIQSSPLGLIRLSLLPSSKIRSLFNDKVRISGDIELGQQMKKLFDDLDLDWEGHLAHFTGDVVAHSIGSLFRQGKALTQQWSHSLQRCTTEYVQEEIRFFPSHEEVNDFLTDVDALVLRTERLAALIQLYQAEYERD